ncbi:hypothetical protein GCM10010497_42030 [Streptomyces cinereoruber]|uniref:Uncharacterized protein n=1 Tax=Streptomyces cinereoruber TaxID=67260 RepID=A0AAV4KQM4_9ACTN|nr:MULTISPECIES: hypothetical protein [Streptomyces]MBB4156580.1 hypothetical protein [Streptomyces cinereoruber]NIH61347.1 hypothetical protein [Streptomyces cinereoruber]GGR34993.1 hypothetical protein GCM10010497_42030 [Streptomyces cinereoruber]
MGGRRPPDGPYTCKASPVRREAVPGDPATGPVRTAGEVNAPDFW